MKAIQTFSATYLTLLVWILSSVSCRPWPDLSCYPTYSSNFIEAAHSWCTNNINTGGVYKVTLCLSRECCVLHMMGILRIYRHRRGRNETLWMGPKGRKSFGEMLYGELQPTFQSKNLQMPKPQAPDPIKNLVMNRLVKQVYGCQSVFKQVHYVWRLKDTEWGLLYNCIHRALGCYHFFMNRLLFWK